MKDWVSNLRGSLWREIAAVAQAQELFRTLLFAH
jgi:hypothetical protein